MRFNFSLTWDEWWPLWLCYPAEKRHVIGFGPVFIEMFWGSGPAPWET